MKNLLIVTGGSGGHVIPSISLFEHLKNTFSVKIVTDLRGSKFIDNTKYNYELLDVPNLFLKPYFFPINIFKYFYKIIESLSFLKKNKINIVISTGGYMTFPFCLAAFFLKKKIILLEPNSVLGRSNKIALSFSNKIICYSKNLRNFPKKYTSKKAIIDPILKKQIYKIKKNSPNYKTKISKVLVIGGSQGASFFDEKVTELIIKISKKHKFDVVQQISNKNSIPMIKKKYNEEGINFNFFQYNYDDIDIYNGVNFAITRGGAGTLSELSFLNIPFLAIPLPKAKDNHQYYNSDFYHAKNCCWMINQSDFEINKVSNFIFNIFNDYEIFCKKIHNLEKTNKKNNWNTINKRIIEIINEN